MFIIFLLLVIVGYIIYRISTNKKREQEKQQIEFDASVIASAVNIVSAVKDLKGDCVKILRDGEKVVLVFEKDSVYVECTGDSSSKRCILNWVQNDKKILGDEDNKAFTELVYNSLCRVPWMNALLVEQKIIISKSDKVSIPYAD